MLENYPALNCRKVRRNLTSNNLLTNDIPDVEILNFIEKHRAPVNICFNPKQFVLSPSLILKKSSLVCLFVLIIRLVAFSKQFFANKI